MKPINRLVSLILSVSLLLVLALSAIPQPVQAATTCVAYHTVRAGDTTMSIAHTYGLKWREIAVANNLKIGEVPLLGARLCIPGGGLKPAPTFNLTASSIHGVVSVTVSGLKERSSFYVRIRDGQSSVGGFVKLGIMRVNKNKTTTARFSLPTLLRTKMYVQVCLKNGTTNEMVCKTVLNRP